MAKFFYRRILQGKTTIDDVPITWKAEVQVLIDAAKKVAHD